MKILVINSGSSSLKYQLFDMEKNTILAKGGCERIGGGGYITHKPTGKEKYESEVDLPTHDEALKLVFSLLEDKKYGVVNTINDIDAIGHRVAHGGEKYKESSKVDQTMISYLESIVPINPLHGPAAIKGMKAALKLLPNTPQTATFDTSYYSTIEPKRYIYGLPYKFYKEDTVRRYGFHGTSHRFVVNAASEYLKVDKNNVKIITCHIGNGSSITATFNGKAVATSMGFTPQEGVLMGTRSGDMDPTIIPYLMEKHHISPSEMSNILTKQSGLLGVSEVSNDCRNVEESAEKGNYQAKLALDILYDSIKRYIGTYIAYMNGVDILVFTAGIGENSYLTREKVCDNMSYLGIEINYELNKNLERGKIVDISGKNSKVKVLVVPTNEEYMIALDTKAIVERSK